MRFLIILLTAFQLASFANAQQKPLSCEVLTLNVAMTAIERDRGLSRNSTSVGKDVYKEFTKAEKKFILDAVYVSGKNQTPDQIKDQVYYACKKVRG
ncbi:MAG: hypothetical protein IPG98_07080 [Burkholderiales bacterium]|nr:hypothetical protein [Burkholderiales bacterium]MBK8665802.1 hypothetical protein [Burkholderiales bacterium]